MINKIDLNLESPLHNKTCNELYIGCEIDWQGSSPNLKTPPAEAIRIISNNLEKIIQSMDDRSELLLTGRMAIWAYLVVFHEVVHRFRKIWYSDGYKGDPILIAAHG